MNIIQKNGIQKVVIHKVQWVLFFSILTNLFNPLITSFKIMLGDTILLYIIIIFVTPSIKLFRVRVPTPSRNSPMLVNSLIDIFSLFDTSMKIY